MVTDNSLKVLSINTTEQEVGEIQFSDGVVLALLPYHPPRQVISQSPSHGYLTKRLIHWINNTPDITQFDAALLYKGGNLEALATDIPKSRFKGPIERGFWSRGKTSQEELAGYWEVAFQAVAPQYNEAFDRYVPPELSKRIEILTRGAYTHSRLKHEEMPVLVQLPERFADRVTYNT